MDQLTALLRYWQASNAAIARLREEYEPLGPFDYAEFEKVRPSDFKPQLTKE